jgi:hypothetical protein
MTWTLEITKAEGSAFEGTMSFEGASNFVQKPERISGVVRSLRSATATKLINTRIGPTEAPGSIYGLPDSPDWTVRRQG